MDPSRFTKQDENADKNKELLLSLMGRVLNDIFHSVSSFPQKVFFYYFILFYFIIFFSQKALSYLSLS